MKNIITDNKKIKQTVFWTAFTVAIAVFYFFAGCPIRWLTGVCCPSCGMTRAVFSLITFEPESAFHYHPMVFSLPVILLIYLFRKYLPEKTLSISVIVFFVLLLIVYFFRLLSGNEIVYADFTSGIIYKIFNL